MMRMAPGLTAVDGILGAALTAVVGLGIAWVLGALALANGGQARREVQRSAILQKLNAVLPPSEGLLSALARLDPFPRIDGPEANVAAPTASIARTPGVRAAADSVVKILGNACGLGVEGSGWVAGDELVVTNAHVVAGQKDTRVLLRGRQPGLDAVAVSFDPKNDLAVLRVPGLKATALTIADPVKTGTSAAILGFPGNGPYDVRAGRVGQTREVITQDAYGQGPVRRSITSLRGAVRSGNSGGPMVDRDGQVVTTVFAATTSGPRGGFGVPNAIAGAALERAKGSSGVSTGPCAG
jgi:S1-C subfamily serine protease